MEMDLISRNDQCKADAWLKAKLPHLYNNIIQSYTLHRSYIQHHVILHQMWKKCPTTKCIDVDVCEVYDCDWISCAGQTAQFLVCSREVEWGRRYWLVVLASLATSPFTLCTVGRNFYIRYLVFHVSIQLHYFRSGSQPVLSVVHSARLYNRHWLALMVGGHATNYLCDKYQCL